MAWTARHGDDLVETLETDEVLDAHCAELAKLIRASSHFVAYTGAGISTSGGMPDFRGPNGVWTLAREGKKAKGATPTLQVVPTVAHMSLVALQNTGSLKHVISSNCDGLHVKSGIVPDNITEVHGNCLKEECGQCGRSFYRDYSTHARVNPQLVEHLKLVGRAANHFTGRMCICGGPLCDSIINFGENLSEKVLKTGFYHGNAADLMVAMGASLTVSPSCDMVAACKRKRGGGASKLVIINLQRTPYDDICDLRIFHKTDDVWMRVMKLLGVAIPPFTLPRRLACWNDDNDNIKASRHGDAGVLLQRLKNVRAQLCGLSADGTPATWIRAVALANGPQLTETRFTIDPTDVMQCITVPRAVFAATMQRDERQSRLVLIPFGHYHEPPVALTHVHDVPCVTRLTYKPEDGTWVQEREVDGAKSVEAMLQLINPAKKRNSGKQLAEAAAPAAAEQGFAVYPKLDCPHVRALLLQDLVVDCRAPCEMCNDASENWVCLRCSAVFCSRYVNSHMMEHVADGGRCERAIVASFSDFSFWCNACEEYISDPRLNPVCKAMELSKFDGHDE